MNDQYGRNIDYMRISITDRCNLRCCFCMPDDSLSFQKEEELLGFEEFLKVVKAAVPLGIKNFRITGGEPLVRSGVVEFIQKLKQQDGVEKVYLTTNGVLLEENLDGLMYAGIDGINVSLCSTDAKEYEKITGKNKMETVLSAIRKSAEAGIHTKVNCVPLPGMNETHLAELSLLAKEFSVAVRFIEMMPIGQGAKYEMITGEQVLTRLEQVFGKSKRSFRVNGHGPAVYVRFPDFKEDVGFISARTCRFCSQCNRVRLTANGWLKLCLNYEEGMDLKADLRNGCPTEELTQKMKTMIYQKPCSHNFNQTTGTSSYMVNTKYMAQIGG